jgi:hypothetical protein
MTASLASADPLTEEVHFITWQDASNVIDWVRQFEPSPITLDESFRVEDWPLEKLSLLCEADQIRWVRASVERRRTEIRRRNNERAEESGRNVAESGLGWIEYMTNKMRAEQMMTQTTTAPANDNQPSPRPKWPGIISSADFVRSFTPPDYAIDGIVQTGFLYSVTASTGTGKTAILLLLSALTALGNPLGSKEVKQGRVLYFAGENPDDVGMRWIGAAHHMGFDPDDIDVYFVPGAFDIAALVAEVESAVDAIGGVDLVVIDTSAAYFNGTDENSNVDMGKHARNLRGLTTLPGSPCVLVACHPTKSADQSNLLPRGGGAFIAEVDGNLTCQKTDHGTVKLHWQGKHRGPDFAPIMFDLSTVNAPGLQDSRGRPIPTVMASVLSEGEVAERAVQAHREGDDVLLLVEAEPKLSQSAIAERMGWFDKDGKPHKRRAQTVLTKLRGQGLLDVARSGGHELTSKGQEVVTDVRGERHYERVGAAGADAITGRKSPWKNRTDAAPSLLASA